VQVLVNVESEAEIPSGLLDRGVRATLEAEEIDRGEVSVTVLDDAGIRAMNRRWLGRDRPTDVLSFRLHDPGEPVLGDIYLGIDQARRQAEERGIPLDEELLRLAVHGTLHLLGHDHPEGPEREESEMFRLQEALVSRVLAGKGGEP